MFLEITVVGAGITGLWQALTHAHRGHAVRLIEQAAAPFTRTASQYAGAMLAPFCERESAPALVEELGLRSLEIWNATFPGVVNAGTLVVAQPRDRNELVRFASRTNGHQHVGGKEIAALEPDLGGRFLDGYFYPREAHVEPGAAMAFLLKRARRLGVEVALGRAWTGSENGIVIDCRGMGAREDLPSLRGVRGERIILQAREVCLKRPIRLLHPRGSLYVVPWGMGTFMIGATAIESEDAGPVSVRSALGLLGLAYTLHPAFGDARVIGLDAGLRPAFPDNLPKIVVKGRHIFVNGLYRHGFLLAPALAELMADYLETGTTRDELFLQREAGQGAGEQDSRAH